jgi:uncharacterized membrane protein YdjX (TVP38/TMEM64 family)
LLKKHGKSLRLMVLLIFFLTMFLIINTKIDNLSSFREALLKLGPWAPYVFIVVCIFRSFMLLPCGIFSVSGGILFEPLNGSIFALVGFTLNSILVYYMASYFGRNWVKDLLGNKFNTIHGLVNKNSFISFFYLRAVPLLPFDAVSCLGGISKAKLNNFILATLFGSMPGIFLYTFFGGTLKSLSLRRAAIPAVFILLVSLVPAGYKLFHHFKPANKSDYKDSDSTI